MILNINEEQRLVLLAAIDMYEGSEEASIRESVECVDIEELLRAIVTPDLLFIRKHVTTWPVGAETVRLDKDGEICFVDATTEYDVYPDGYDISMFRHEQGHLRTGIQYTEQEWSAN